MRTSSSSIIIAPPPPPPPSSPADVHVAHGHALDAPADLDVGLDVEEALAVLGPLAEGDHVGVLLVVGVDSEHLEPEPGRLVRVAGHAVQHGALERAAEPRGVLVAPALLARPARIRLDLARADDLAPLRRAVVPQRLPRNRSFVAPSSRRYAARAAAARARLRF